MGELLIISGSKNSLPVLRELFKQTDYSQIEHARFFRGPPPALYEL